MDLNEGTKAATETEKTAFNCKAGTLVTLSSKSLFFYLFIARCFVHFVTFGS